MADILDNGGNTQDAERANEAILLTPFELLQQLGQAAWQLVKKGDEWGRAAFKDLEVGNKKLLPETATPDDLEAVETAVQDPENAKVEVNAVATTDQGEVVRATVADPWDEEVEQVVDKALSQLEPLESEAIAVDAVVVEPEQQPSQTQSTDRPLVNEFIDKAGENIKQGANNFAAQANAFIAENIQVEYQPIPQQDGTVALAIDKPSLLTQMSLAGGNFAQAAKDEMKKLAPQQFERVSQTVKNTQEKVQGAISHVSDSVLERLNDPPLSRHIDDLESRIGGELQDIKLEMNELRSNQYSINHINGEVVNEFKAEVSALRSQVGNLEGQIATMQQQQVKLDQMIAALQTPKPQLNNPRLNQWQSKFVAQAKEKFQKAKQYLGNKVDQVKAKVGELVEGFKQKTGELLQPIVDRLKPVYDQAQDLKQKTGEQINQVKATVGEKVDHAKQFVGEKAMDWQAQALAATATYVLAQQGKQTPQGTTIYEGQHFDFHRNQGNSLLIVDKATQQPVYKDGEFNQNAPKEVKDKLIKAAQTTQKGLEQKQAHKQA
ncbi:hypothetical protein ACSYAD_25975, partial [Acaryochloris marina NIES-2412]|uniref:hypothetical protein n=1 Tax=Acaryochloris marina TaxID=155978 RepID=UPI00405A2E01